MNSDKTTDFLMLNTTPESSKSSQPLIVFVLGYPCAGKSTLCTTLVKEFNLDHFSIGDELRDLISSNTTGHAARVKSKLSDAELGHFGTNVKAGTLAPSNVTPKYVKERIFPDGMVPPNLRILIDGFPRGVDRWETFKDSVKDIWQPDSSTWTLLLCVDRTTARQRFLSRGRAGDVFEKRFDDHEDSIGKIVAAMKQDEVNVVEIDAGPDSGWEDVLSFLHCIPGLHETKRE
ncbi:UMP-CMP kinase [Alternaria panax]|uniref:UMP-CMP kinase n=1 Tax=Alternaria panax TaxID=48097 RepID=A0AAD4I6B9_9PLEO|nr:UMP-CMP kinase [Alternaria panax]